MADTAFQTQYRQEFIASFERRTSFLRAMTTTESVIKGNQAVFQVAGSGGAAAKTRGVNGLIPARSDDLNQLTAILQEWHDLVRKTNFNVFASQGDQKRIMQESTMAVINRKIDDDIIAQLDTATNTTGVATTDVFNVILKARAILGNNQVDLTDGNNIFGMLTPAMDSSLMKITSYASADYVEVKPFEGPARRFRRWANVNWIIHSGALGAGTNNERAYVWHRDAIGHAVDKNGIDSPVGYDEEQAYSWARASVNMGSKLLQNSGVVKIVHDGSAYVPS